MPKRSNFKGGNRVWNNPNRSNNAKYDEHDDRDRKPGGGDLTIRKGANRRVSFKTSNQSKQNPRFSEKGIRSRLSDIVDDDDDMIEVVNSAKSGAPRRRGSPVPRAMRRKTNLVDSGSGWFRVTILYGKKYDKEFLLKSLLQQLSPEIFIPHYWQEEGMNIVFFVDDYKMGNMLASASRKIDLPDGFKLNIHVKNGSPSVVIDEKLREIMKLAMVKRYNATTNALDLTKFYSDPDLKENFCSLARAPILHAVIDIISTNIPNLEALNLDNNKLTSLDMFKCLGTKLPNLKILHLANNKIQAIGALIPLKQTNVIDLVLTGNPVRSNFRDQAVYVSEVRKRLPKIVKLDGVELPPQIRFDVEEEEKAIPSALASFLCDQAGADMVRQFLQQYFIIYDSNDRSPLAQAYHQNAMFSLTASFNPNPAYKLTKYLPFNRNLQRIRDLSIKVEHLKTGQTDIIKFLSQLPSTEHDLQSFAVDLTVFTPSLILLTVTGIFREKNAASTSSRSEPLLRSFHRSLVVVPVGSGFCIKNDMLHVNTLTSAQLKTAFKPIAPEPVTTGPIQQPVVPTPTSAVSAAAVTPAPDDTTKLQMIQAMSQLSHMNIEWSKNCLEQTNWDFERAGFAFTELNKQGKIPPEAFVK